LSALQWSSALPLWISPELGRVAAAAGLGSPEDELGPRPLPASLVELAPAPGLLLLSAADLQGPRRAELLPFVASRAPARPIIYGGAGDRRLLLDAINTWRALHLVPEGSPGPVLRDAVVQAREACLLALRIEHRSQELLGEVHDLEEALAQLRTTQEHLLHAERLGTIGRVTGALAQRLEQLHGSLTRFSERLGAVPRAPGAEDIDEVVDCALEGVDGIGALLRDMRALAENRNESAALTPESLDHLADLGARLFRSDPDARRRVVQVRCNCGLWVMAERSRLLHVLMNLLRNAVDATEPGDLIVVRTLEGPEGEAWLEVEDSGPGMSEAQQARLFEPFYTTKGERGMGLGLRLSRAAVERQGGRLECESRVGVGTCFRVALRRVGPPKEGTD